MKKVTVTIQVELEVVSKKLAYELAAELRTQTEDSIEAWANNLQDPTAQLEGWNVRAKVA